MSTAGLRGHLRRPAQRGIPSATEVAQHLIRRSAPFNCSTGGPHALLWAAIQESRSAAHLEVITMQPSRFGRIASTDVEAHVERYKRLRRKKRDGAVGGRVLRRRPMRTRWFVWRWPGCPRRRSVRRIAGALRTDGRSVRRRTLADRGRRSLCSRGCAGHCRALSAVDEQLRSAEFAPIRCVAAWAAGAISGRVFIINVQGGNCDRNCQWNRDSSCRSDGGDHRRRVGDRPGQRSTIRVRRR